MSTATMPNIVKKCINNPITKENIVNFIRDYTSAFAEYIVKQNYSSQNNDNNHKDNSSSKGKEKKNKDQENKDQKDKGKQDSYTQVCRYYVELLRLRDKISNIEDFKNALPAIYIISSKAAYSKARGFLSNNFYKFIDKHIKDIKTIEDFDNFMLCFESIVGYIKYYEEKFRKAKNASKQNSLAKQYT